MKRLLMVGLFATLLTLALTKPAAAGVHVSVGIGLPPFGAVITTGPVYPTYPVYAPYPVYGPPPVYFPAPVYYPRVRYRPAYYGRPYYGYRGGYWNHRHCR